MAKRRVGVEYSPSMLEPVRPGAVSPDRALYLPTFSHSVVVNKTERERERERESKKARDRERERGESSLSLPSLPFFLSFSLRVPLLPYPSPFSLSPLSLSLALSISHFAGSSEMETILPTPFPRLPVAPSPKARVT